MTLISEFTNPSLSLLPPHTERGEKCVFKHDIKDFFSSNIEGMGYYHLYCISQEICKRFFSCFFYYGIVIMPELLSSQLNLVHDIKPLQPGSNRALQNWPYYRIDIYVVISGGNWGRTRSIAGYSVQAYHHRRQRNIVFYPKTLYPEEFFLMTF